MHIAFKAIQYGGVDNIPPTELTHDEKKSIKQYKYEISNELETATAETKAGDTTRSTTGAGSNYGSNISVRTAINLCDVNPITVN